MTKLTSRVDRLEQGDDRCCTLAEIFDAIEAEERGEKWPPLRPFDPQLSAVLARLDADATSACDRRQTPDMRR